MARKMRTSLVFILCGVVMLGAVAPVLAQSGKDPFHTTGLPVPRFMALGEDKIHVRAGPGKTYPIRWVFNKKNLPIQVVQEYETWRKIKDSDGQEGWVMGMFLSSRRTAIVKSKEPVELFDKTSEKRRKIALIAPNVVASIEECNATWCDIEAGGYHGWIDKKFLWGNTD